MRVYEELFIVRPGTPDEELDALIEQLHGVVTTAGGTVDKTDKWGVRRLAYRVKKFGEGIYTLIVFNAPASAVKEIERRLRVTDAVIKFITVRIDEKMKKIDKRRKAREKRAARKPLIPVAQPSAAPSAPAMPIGDVPSGPTPGAPAPGAPVPASPEAPPPAASPEAHAPAASHDAPPPAASAEPATEVAATPKAE